MQYQTAVDKTGKEIILRTVRNSTTGTSTVVIAAGTPLVLETATASADGVFANQALTSTSVVNNLYIGNCHAALAADSLGLCQVYGVDTDAVVATGGASVGVPLIPNIATLVTIATSTASLPSGVGSSNSAVVLIAPTGAAQAATSVFLNLL